MKRFPFWSNKILPLVYDGALSYYEAVSRVVAKLNELISWSNGVNATVSAAGEAANEAEGKAIDALNAAERAEGKATEAKATANEAKSIAQGIAGDIPTKTSELTNDSGFITDADIPTKTSELTNDSGFITDADIPTKTSELTNDSGFITDADVPTKTSELTNDSNFITREQVLTWPAVEDNMTTLQVMALAQNRIGAALSWTKYGNCTYTPTQSTAASWVFQLNSKISSSTLYVYFTATNTTDGSMYVCDASGVWKQVALTSFVYTLADNSLFTTQVDSLPVGCYSFVINAYGHQSATGMPTNSNYYGTIYKASANYVTAIAYPVGSITAHAIRKTNGTWSSWS